MGRDGKITLLDIKETGYTGFLYKDKAQCQAFVKTVRNLLVS
jgi:hypothetical protein